MRELSMKKFINDFLGFARRQITFWIVYGILLLVMIAFLLYSDPSVYLFTKFVDGELVIIKE